jgi:hypothetical protein
MQPLFTPIIQQLNFDSHTGREKTASLAQASVRNPHLEREKDGRCNVRSDVRSPDVRSENARCEDNQEANKPISSRNKHPLTKQERH